MAVACLLSEHSNLCRRLIELDFSYDAYAASSLFGEDISNQCCWQKGFSPCGPYILAFSKLLSTNLAGGDECGGTQPG